MLKVVTPAELQDAVLKWQKFADDLASYAYDTADKADNPRVIFNALIHAAATVAAIAVKDREWPESDFRNLIDHHTTNSLRTFFDLELKTQRPGEHLPPGGAIQ